MLAHHKLLVILIDKSQGTAYEHAKDDFVESIERHIRYMVNERAVLSLPGLARPRARKQLRGEPNGGSPPLQQRE